MLLTLLSAVVAFAEPSMKFRAVVDSTACDSARRCEYRKKDFGVLKIPLVKFSPEWTVAVWEPEVKGAHFQVSFTRQPPEPLHNILQVTGGLGEDVGEDVSSEIAFRGEVFPESLSLMLPYREAADGSGQDFHLTLSEMTLSQ